MPGRIQPSLLSIGLAELPVDTWADKASAEGMAVVSAEALVLFAARPPAAETVRHGLVETGTMVATALAPTVAEPLIAQLLETNVAEQIALEATGTDELPHGLDDTTVAADFIGLDLAAPDAVALALLEDAGAVLIGEVLVADAEAIPVGLTEAAPELLTVGLVRLIRMTQDAAGIAGVTGDALLVAGPVGDLTPNWSGPTTEAVAIQAEE